MTHIFIQWLAMCQQQKTECKQYPETWEVLIIKWSTSVEPPVGSGNHSGSNFSSNLLLFCVDIEDPVCFAVGLMLDITKKYFGILHS